MHSPILYEENQVFLRGPAKKFLLAVNLLIVAVYLIERFTTNDSSRESNYVVLGITAVFFLLTILLQKIKLVTQVSDTGIYINFYPLHKPQLYLWEQIEEITIRRYNPIVEYGGWGVRYSPAGIAFNAFGNIGVQLQFKNKRKVMIGTQDPETFAKILLQLGKLNNYSL